jgi:prepilin-type N-terminal cleavage/methylation domain-containing protein/prepilin-type processing-associated H-X9-DG protein
VERTEMSRRRPAFTLVELLVVIGIISVLIGILLPTIAGARRNAATIKCASNLRSLGQALHLYVNEQKGYVPTYRATYGTLRVPWYDQLARYVFNRSASGTPPSIINHIDFAGTIFAGCPSIQFVKQTGAGVINSSTGYGITSLPVAPLEPLLAKDKNNVYVHASATPPGRYFKFTELKNPANRAMMADMNGWGGLRALDPGPTYYTKPSEGGSPQGDIDYYRHGKVNIGEYGPTPADVERGRLNVLFCDGHVDLCTPWQAWWSVRDPSRRTAGSDKGP